MNNRKQNLKNSQLESRDITIKVNQKKFTISQVDDSQKSRIYDKIVDISKQEEHFNYRFVLRTFSAYLLLFPIYFLSIIVVSTNFLFLLFAIWLNVCI